MTDKEQTEGVSAAEVLRLQDQGATDEIFQEILLHEDGTVEIPWFVPEATPLILEVWDEIGRQSFPIKIPPNQRIYCG